MYILRIKLRDSVLEFHAETIMEIAEMELVARKTNCDGFTAIPDKDNPKKGKVLSKWSYDHMIGNREVIDKCATFTVKWGAYSDHVWCVIDTKDNVDQMVHETNEKVTCWASVSAKPIHIGGDMWACQFTDPFKD